MKIGMKVAGLAILLVMTATGCPQKPNPYCPDSLCVHAPTTSVKH